MAPELKIEIREPKVFTAKAVLVVCAYGIFLCVPVFISLLALSLRRLGLFSFVYPLVVMAATAFFLPFGFGNPYLSRLLRKSIPRKNTAALVAQITMKPRIRGGIRALVEDADDIGWFSVDDNGLVFEGDSVRCTVPSVQIKKVELQNVGLRGLFVYRAIAIKIPAIPNVEWIQIAERSSCLLPASRKITKELFKRISSLVPANQTSGQQTKS